MTKKVVCAVLYIYIFNFIAHFHNTFINKKLLLIHYLCHEMAINVLHSILSDNDKY